MDIKFRGLSKETGKFAYGNLLQSAKFKDGRRDCWIQPRSLLCLGAISTPTTSFVRIDNDSVGQFIGLQDINGADIYAGDLFDCEILSRIPGERCGGDYWVKCMCKVEFIRGAFKGVVIKQLSYMDVDFNLHGNTKELNGERLIIGYIHQNKDLLK
jgi:uncharacterized phage protein (TIGR01671 family)